MNDEQALLAALHADPADNAAWLALADCLEEAGQTERAELLRLHRRLRGLDEGPQRERMEGRLRQLLLAGVRPCVPTLTSSIGMELALVPACTFLMGSAWAEPGRDPGEEPRHEVEITRPFYLGVFPVTQAQWRAVMGNNPSWFSATGLGKDAVKELSTDGFPVEHVSWEDATAFLEKLSGMREEREAGRKYRLPSEAEWEYACRAATSSSTAFGNALFSTQANFNGPFRGDNRGPYLGRTCAVGSYRPNAFGLHDMHGNVHEWCADWFDKTYYAHTPGRDPAGPSRGDARVIRGGCWFVSWRCCRSASRGRASPAGRGYDVGFRAALVLSGG
jgi:uncharacterized protein (TIGR02996 family)